MSRGTQSFKQSDLTKALRAAKKAGLEIQRVVFDPKGGFALIPGAPSGPQIAGSANEWDDVIR